MKNKLKTYILIFVLAVLLVSCKTNNIETAAPTPIPGKSVAIGKVLLLDGSPLMNTPIRLAEVYRGENDGAFALDEAHSPSTMSDSNGQFIFTNIEPGEYVIFIGSINLNYTIISNSDGSAIVYEVIGDEINKFDTIKVDFPNN